VGQAESTWYPQLSASASTEYRDSKGIRAANVPDQHRFTSLGFGVSWLLFDFGRTPAVARQAAAEWLAAQEDTRTADVVVAFNVRAAYYALVKEIQLRDVARDAVQQFQEHLDQVSEFVKVGTRIPYDETKAEVDLGNAKLALVQQEDLVLLDQANLANAMGLAETTDWQPQAVTTPVAAPPSFEECWARAEVAVPTIAAARARETAADELVNAQIAALYPSLSLGFNYNAAGSSAPYPWSWSVGPSVTWLPFDGFRNLYTIDEAVTALQAARVDRSVAEQQAWLDARSAWLAIEDARRQLELNALQVRNAEENLTLAQGRFDAGKATSVELTDARQALLQAQATQVQTRADYDVATARLAKAMGSTGGDPAAAAAPGGK
jgi:outer membrane protein TolC